MKQVLRRSLAVTAALAVAVLMALSGASPAVAGGDEGDPSDEWIQDIENIECNSFQVGSLCLDFAVIGES